MEEEVQLLANGRTTSKQRRMTMDFSQLHTYTPPQCAPDNTGYTYSLSSSYSTAALDFEKEHQIAPVYESPRMSRRSLRLQTSAGLHGNESSADHSQNHSSSYTSTRRETRKQSSRKQQSSSLSLSLSQAATPRKTLSFSAVSTPITNSSSFQESSVASEASQLTSGLDQSQLRHRTITTTTTTSVDGHWGHGSSFSSSVNGDASVSKSHSSRGNGYICKDCSLHSQRTDSLIAQSSSSLLSSSSSSSQAAEASTDGLSSSSSPFTSIYTRDRSRRSKTAHSSFCGSMNVKDLVTEDASHLKLNGSLCYCLLQPGYCVVRAGKALGSGVGTSAQRLLSVLWMLLAAPVKAGRGLLWFLASGWYQLVSLMSLLNVFFLTKCLPRLWKLLWLLLPLLLLLALWLWGPSTAALLAYLPAVNLTEWRSASPLTFLSNMVPVPAPVPAAETPVEATPASTASQAPPTLPPVVVSGVDLERLERVERQLALLWEQVRQGDEKQEQRHGDILGLYSTLRDQLHSQTDRESLGLWVSSLLEQRLGVLRGELQDENTHREQSAEQQKQHQESQAARLAGLEALLKALATKTEELQQKQQQYEHEKEKREEEDVTPPSDTAPVSAGVQQEDHDALLAEVQRLEVELSRIRQDLQGVMGCKGKCEQLDTLQDTISAQVSSQLRKELQALFFGSGGSAEEQELPESLVLWLSQRYVSTPDLKASLASLEHSILRNISLQLELSRAQTLGEAESQTQTIVKTISGTVQHTSAAEGLTEEHVKLIVQNALKLYSQDRTGLVDYALESGGGSILSTRCSETYETKTALMSLFGLPLWYFSQSPRVVIQPDVYPGNCWAFKGSQGYLVIRLSLRILPTSFCVEHIPKTLSPTGNITSAPRNFTVYGLDDEYQEEGKLLGHYTYQEDGESLQTFPVQEQNDKVFQIIEVRVLSNWGHPEYTCMYRFRVHGEPRPQ
ncbi:SUN domain-containing protein 1 isoform X10 [Acanthochromis polyacanthus]|uniref:SUN domain-containing protein 1 isoform X10 n=1 Tax=Acanthochromis polyacanthus TaxID=80966 RepID=UPI002234E732|nr:SUN domain-containing protein 1 isoform X10 [Acanthochromis polyacanthus]